MIFSERNFNHFSNIDKLIRLSKLCLDRKYLRLSTTCFLYDVEKLKDKEPNLNDCISIKNLKPNRIYQIGFFDVKVIKTISTIQFQYLFYGTKDRVNGNINITKDYINLSRTMLKMFRKNYTGKEFQQIYKELTKKLTDDFNQGKFDKVLEQFIDLKVLKNHEEVINNLQTILDKILELIKPSIDLFKLFRDIPPYNAVYKRMTELQSNLLNLEYDINKIKNKGDQKL